MNEQASEQDTPDTDSGRVIHDRLPEAEDALPFVRIRVADHAKPEGAGLNYARARDYVVEIDGQVVPMVCKINLALDANGTGMEIFPVLTLQILARTVEVEGPAHVVREFLSMDELRGSGEAAA